MKKLFKIIKAMFKHNGKIKILGITAVTAISLITKECFGATVAIVIVLAIVIAIFFALSIE